MRVMEALFFYFLLPQLIREDNTQDKTGGVYSNYLMPLCSFINIIFFLIHHLVRKKRLRWFLSLQLSGYWVLEKAPKKPE